VCWPVSLVMQQASSLTERGDCGVRHRFGSLISHLGAPHLSREAACAAFTTKHCYHEAKYHQMFGSAASSALQHLLHVPAKSISPEPGIVGRLKTGRILVFENRVQPWIWQSRFGRVMPHGLNSSKSCSTKWSPSWRAVGFDGKRTN
jgi:hypothetical protein